MLFFAHLTIRIKNFRPMIKTLYRHRSGTLVMNLDTDQLLAAVQDKQSTIWIDLVSPSAEEYDLVLKQAYRFHPLAIEDTINDIHIPKLDNYGSYLYLVFHSVDMGDERMDIHTKELDVFLGRNYLVTIRTESMSAIDALWNEKHHQEYGLAQGPVYLLYELLDRQIDRYIPLIERFEERLEELGDDIFRQNGYHDEGALNDILTAKSSSLRLHRILRPQRDLVQMLVSKDYAVIPSEAILYFQDVYDHLVRLTDLSDSMCELASSTMDTYLALANNRMNQVMKVLTIASTIFMPLSFLAGVYGMNFDRMPELHIWWTYPMIWIIFIAIAVGMLTLFRRLRWL